MSFNDWQNDPARLRQLYYSERLRTGKLRAENKRLARALSDLAGVLWSWEPEDVPPEFYGPLTAARAVLGKL